MRRLGRPTTRDVVLSMRTLPDVPSSVAIKALRRWAGEL
jgi:SulP family sulfate permease